MTSQASSNAVSGLHFRGQELNAGTLLILPAKWTPGELMYCCTYCFSYV